MISDPLKVCDVTQFYSPLSGGVKRYLHEKIRYIETRSPQDEHVLVIPGDKTQVTESGRSRVYTIKSPMISRSTQYRALLNLAALEEILVRERPDIIESSDPYQVGWRTATIGQSHRIPVVAFYHSHFPEAYLHGPFRLLRPVAEAYVRMLYDRYQATLVPSPELAQILDRWGVRNVREVSLGVNTEYCSPDPNDSIETRNALGVAPDRLLLLYVGRLAPEKNTATLASAFEILSKRRPEKFAFLVIGDGPQRKMFDALRQTNSEMKWLQYCADPVELARYYRCADLFVHPGILETFGLVALESQACGTPVVGIRGSRMDRIICHDQESWASENTPESLANAIEAFSERDLATIGRNAAETVAERYAWPRVFDHLSSIYREVIENFRQRSRRQL